MSHPPQERRVLALWPVPGSPLPLPHQQMPWSPSLCPQAPVPISPSGPASLVHHLAWMLRGGWVVTALLCRSCPLPAPLPSELTLWRSPLRLSHSPCRTRPATMQLGLLLCLMLLSPQVATFRRHRSREVKKRVKESPLVATVSPCSRDFTFGLYRALAAAAPDQNIFFSPLSISITLAVLSLGAQANTKAQILEGLGLTQQGRPAEELHEAFQQLLCELGQPREDMQLSLGNALFVGLTVPIREAFLSAMRTLYLADTFPTNFGDPAGAQRQINDYVAKETKGKIVDLVKDLDSTEIMVMVNYIFFKGKTLGLEPELSLIFQLLLPKEHPIPTHLKEWEYV